MKAMKRLRNVWCAALGVVLCGVFALAAPTDMPEPGTLNYVEGQAAINGETIAPQSVESQLIGPGGTLSTQNGKAEVLLTPGVFLRLGDYSKIKMISPDLADTEFALLEGQATIEADQFNKNNRLSVDQGAATTSVEKKGLYLLNAGPPYVQVLDGKAKVALNGKHVDVGKNHEAVLNSEGKLKTRDFDKDAVNNSSLIRWSRLRSEYEAQANLDTARTVIVNDGWYGPGWYWDQGFGFWSYLPGEGVLYSPFGWGFYSPGFIYSAPGFYGYGHYPRGFNNNRGSFPRQGFPTPRGGTRTAPAPRGGGVRR
ncbi:MAG TPA: hypothetical protein VFW83_05315 [Bryobacteraceae bacterium]|nr:hypothetical protein [Bryobacteraceae bacterium]